MAREGITLAGVDLTNPENVAAELVKLREDFDAHTHDGVNSRAFQTLFAETLVGRAAIIGGYKLFDAMVGPTSSDYKTVAAALNAGKTRIFVRNGTYTSEPKWEVTNANTILVGESYGGVDISFAADVANSRNIYVNATNSFFQNLKLTAYSTSAHDLFNFGASGSKPIIRNCILKNTRGKVFNGVSIADLYATIGDIYIDFTATDDATTMLAFNRIRNSNIFNVFVDADIASDVLLLDTCGESRFSSCFFKTGSTRAVEFSVASSPTAFFINCHFIVYQIQLQANFKDCYIETNGQDPASAMLRFTTAGTEFKSNYVSCDDDHKVLQCTAANVQMVGNYFSGGYDMIFYNSGVASIKGIMFTNNEWVSAFTTSAMTMLLSVSGKAADYGIWEHNVVRNSTGSFTPVITDNFGTGNLKLNNQLISG